jgi:hypothetical protein
MVPADAVFTPWQAIHRCSGGMHRATVNAAFLRSPCTSNPSGSTDDFRAGRHWLTRCARLALAWWVGRQRRRSS